MTLRRILKRLLTLLLLGSAFSLLPSSPAVQAEEVRAARVPDSTENPKVWEINGIRLEPDQVERLSEDMATRTLAAVEENVEDIALAPEQRTRMLAIYKSVALDVYAEIVEVVNRSELSESSKEQQMRDLVLAGQSRSHDQLRSVLSEDQMARYAVWESAQVEAYKNTQDGRRRRRRRR